MLWLSPDSKVAKSSIAEVSVQSKFAEPTLSTRAFAKLSSDIFDFFSDLFSSRAISTKSRIKFSADEYFSQEGIASIL